MKSIKLNVSGMACHGCENRIKNAVSSIKGVKKVEANYETGIVEVDLEESVDEKVIKEKITDLDFEVN